MSEQTQVVGDFAYAMGVAAERERIIKLLEKFEASGNDVITSEYIPTEELIGFITKEK